MSYIYKFCANIIYRSKEVMIKIAVVGCGYWGPNLIRNFVACSLTELAWVYDRDSQKMDRATRMYPGVKKAAALADIINDAEVAAVRLPHRSMLILKLPGPASRAASMSCLKNPWRQALNRAKNSCVWLVSAGCS